MSPPLELPISFHLRDSEQTEQLGAVLGDLLSTADEISGSILLLLSGELGAGKTTLVRGLAHGLGIEAGGVASPTFTIRMDHRGAGRALAHIDAWRIGPHDLESVGFDELLASNAVLAVEWPERIAEALPSRHIRIRLEHSESADERGHPGRVATIDAPGMPEATRRRLAEGLILLCRAARIAPPACPSCGRAAAGDLWPEAPFCSARCRLADLDDWLSMRHRIVAPDEPEFDE